MSAVEAAVKTGLRRLKADLVQADRMREVAVCLNFLERGCAAWRNPGNDYAPTAQGLHRALVDELKRMREGAGRG